MKHDARVLLEDILKETSAHDFASYTSDKILKSAVERWFITIGESLKRIPHHYLGLAARLPDVNLIVDFRNFLVHNYDSLDDTIIWSSVKDKLPPLYKKFCELRNELDHPVQPPPKPPSGPKM